MTLALLFGLLSLFPPVCPLKAGQFRLPPFSPRWRVGFKGSDPTCLTRRRRNISGFTDKRQQRLRTRVSELKHLNRALRATMYHSARLSRECGTLYWLLRRLFAACRLLFATGAPDSDWLVGNICNCSGENVEFRLLKTLNVTYQCIYVWN